MKAARARTHRWWKVGAGAALVLATALLFSPLLGFEFVEMDDGTYVQSNLHLRDGVNGAMLRWAFQGGYASNWHPLTWLSHALDVQWFGLDPGLHHLQNVILHGVNTLLLFLACLALTPAATRHPRARILACGWIAAVFAWHPLRAESVAWVSERKDVLSTCFWLLGLIAYSRFAHRRSLGTGVLLFLCMALGLMAKPMLVTFPLTLLLLDYWPLRRITTLRPADLKLPVIEKLPLFALAAASCLVTLFSQASGGAVSEFEVLPLSERLENAAVATVTYLAQWVWPRKLAVFYPHPEGSLEPWRFGGALLLLAGITAFVWLQRKQRPWLVTGWLWYLATLLPVIGIVQVGSQAMADRYTYVPQIGIALAVGWSGFQLAKRLPKTAALLALISALALPLPAYRQIQTWRNSETLFGHALAVTEQNHVAHVNLGVALAKTGQLERAGRHFEKAVEIFPNHPSAGVNYARFLYRSGEIARSLDYFETAARNYPERSDIAKRAVEAALKTRAFARARQNLELVRGHPDAGLRLREIAMGILHAQTEGFRGYWAKSAVPVPKADVEQLLEFAKELGAILIESNQRAPGSLLLAAIAEAELDFASAARHYRAALEHGPADPATVLCNLGVCYQRLQQPEDAENAYRAASRARPQFFEPLFFLGLLLNRQERQREAVAPLEKAARLRPNHANVLLALGLANIQIGKLDAARKQVELLRQTDPAKAAQLLKRIDS